MTSSIGWTWEPAAIRRQLRQLGIREEQAILVARSASVEGLTRALAEEPDASIRAELCGVLRMRAETASIPALARVLADEDRGVVSCAADALAAMEDPEIAPSLIDALGGNEGTAVRSSLVFALGFSAAREAVSPLFDVLVHDSEPRVRGLAAESLEQIELPESADALSEAAETMQEPSLELRALRVRFLLKADLDTRWAPASFDEGLSHTVGAPEGSALSMPRVETSDPQAALPDQWVSRWRLSDADRWEHRWPLPRRARSRWKATATEATQAASFQAEAALLQWRRIWGSD